MAAEHLLTWFEDGCNFYDWRCTDCMDERTGFSDSDTALSDGLGWHLERGISATEESP